MKYIVMGTTIRHGAGDKVRDYQPGEVIELTAEEASILGAAVQPMAGSATEPSKDGGKPAEGGKPPENAKESGKKA